MEKFLLNIIILISFVYFYRVSRHGIHMLQLESYFNGRYFKWFKKNLKQVFRIKRIVLLLIPTVLIFYNNITIGLVLELIALLLFVVITKKKVEKKPFVVTSRVKRMYATYVLLFIIVAILANVLDYKYTVLIINVLLVLAYIFVMIVNTINSPIEKSIRNKFCRQAKKKLKETTNTKPEMKRRDGYR